MITSNWLGARRKSTEAGNDWKNKEGGGQMDETEGTGAKSTQKRMTKKNRKKTKKTLTGFVLSICKCLL